IAHDQYSHELWSAQEFESRDDGDAPRPGDRVSSGRRRRAGAAPPRHGGGLRAGARLHGALRPPGGGRRRAAAARGGAPQVPSPGPHLSAMGRRAAGGAPDPLRPGRNHDRMLVREPGLFTSLATIVMAPDSPRVLSESRHPVTDIGIGQLITLVLDGARRAGAAGELTVRDDGVAPGADGLERRLEVILPRERERGYD